MALVGDLHSTRMKQEFRISGRADQEVETTKKGLFKQNNPTYVQDIYKIYTPKLLFMEKNTSRTVHELVVQ